MIPVDSFYQKLNSVRAVVVKRKDDLCHGSDTALAGLAVLGDGTLAVSAPVA